MKDIIQQNGRKRRSAARLVIDTSDLHADSSMTSGLRNAK